MVYLRKEGIYSLSTIRRNRLPKCKIPSEPGLKDVTCGTSHEYVTTVNGVDVSSLIWKDNKCVTLIATFVGTNPITEVTRFDRRQKMKISITSPLIIQEYNRHLWEEWTF